MVKTKLLPLILLSFLVAGCGGNPSSSNSGSSSKEEPPSTSSSTGTSSSSSSEEESNFGLTLKMPEGRPLKVAQFADIHFGVEGKDWHNDKVDRTKAYMDYVVETSEPDFIVCSGDNILSTGTKKLEQFIDIMEGYETPWTFIYGNHDAEQLTAGYSKADLHNTLLTYETEYLLYGDDYTDPTANRYGNFSVQLADSTGKKLLGSFIFLDSGLHDGTGYEALTEGQINWYKSTIDTLQATYSAQADNAQEIIPSIAFAHIQLQEHATLYTKAANKDGASFVIEQDLGDDAEAAILDGGPKVNTGMYDAMVEKGSTKGYFVGHAHTYRFQVKDDTHNIVLGFGPQTGFAKCFEDNDLARTTYVYNVSEDMSFTTTPIKEDASKSGLLYSGTYEGKMTVDVETGLYTTGKLEFSIWNRIMFSYKGERITIEDFTGGITGAFVNSYNAPWNENLYTSTGSNFIYSGSKKNIYIFTIDTVNMALNIELWVDPDAPVKPVTEVEVTNVNSDGGADSVNVYTTPTNFKTFNAETGADGWIYNGWRYFIVIDPEGRIAYAVSNPPNGYGGPMGSGYYCNSYYADYTTNPCFELLEGYGPWSNDAEGRLAAKKYNVNVPEGWIGITGHGAGSEALAQAFSNGAVSADDAVVNKKTVYSDSLRVTYDSTNNLIKTSWVE